MSDRHHLPEQVAERYGISAETVMKNVRAKRWPHLRVGKFVRFSDENLAEIDALLTVPVSKEVAATKSWGRKTRGAS